MSHVKNFGAVGDGEADDTEAIVHAVENGGGRLRFTRGNYRITRTIEIDTTKTGRFSMDGDGGLATIIMDGEGPAFRLIGSHYRSAQPDGYTDEIWQQQRMPTIRNIEIRGNHKQANGFELIGTMQATFEGVLIRRCFHGIHLVKHNRNVLISHCHIYDNDGIGIFLDQINLHQCVISGSHISYNKRGGIRIENGNIRNIQITGNDIEYNYAMNDPAAQEEYPSAEIHIEGTTLSVREGTIASNTIQARYSRGGANIRMIGKGSTRATGVGMWTIVGNMCGNNETNMHFIDTRGVTVTGNFLYTGFRRNLLMEGCREMTVVGNTFDHNPDSTMEAAEVLSAGLIRCSECVFSDNVMHDSEHDQHQRNPPLAASREALLEITECNGITINGCRLLDPSPVGIAVKDSSFVTIAGTSVIEQKNRKPMQAAIRWQGQGKANYVTGCTLGKGETRSLDIADTANVKVGENLVDVDRK